MAEGIVWQREQLYCWEKSMCLHPHPPAPPPSYLGVPCIPVEKWNSAMPSQGVVTSPPGRHRCLHTKPRSTPSFVFPPASISIILSSSPEIAELGRLLHTSASVASSSCCRHCGNSKRQRSILYGRRVVSLIAFMHWNCVDWDAEFVLTKLAVGIYEVKYEDLIWVNRIVRIWRGNLLTCTVCFLLAMEIFFFPSPWFKLFGSLAGLSINAVRTTKESFFVLERERAGLAIFLDLHVHHTFQTFFAFSKENELSGSWPTCSLVGYTDPYCPVSLFE